MEKRKCLTFLFCLILCYSLFQHIAIAQSPSQAIIFSQGSIAYPSSNVNLAVIPDDWELTYGSGPQIIHLDYNVAYDGDVSIRLDPHTSSDVNTNRECDGTWYDVKPGDHIVASVWILVGDSSTGDTSPYDGARLGMDMYAHTSQGYGEVDGYPQTSQEHIDGMVDWGTNTWTQKTLDITIPSTYYTSVVIGGTTTETCNPVQVDSFVLWLQVLQPTDGGLAWFANAVLYINPT
jgi:hypothetical protein